MLVAHDTFGIDQENGRDSPHPESRSNFKGMIETGRKQVSVLFPVGAGLALAVVEAGIDSQYLQPPRTELLCQPVDFRKLAQAVNAPGIPENQQQGFPCKGCTGEEFAIKGLNAEIRQRLTHLGAPTGGKREQQQQQQQWDYRVPFHTGHH